MSYQFPEIDDLIRRELSIQKKQAFTSKIKIQTVDICINFNLLYCFTKSFFQICQCKSFIGRTILNC